MIEMTFDPLKKVVSDIVDKEAFKYWYKEKKLVLWSLYIIFIFIIPYSIMRGEFNLALWQFIAYQWFHMSMEYSRSVYKIGYLLEVADNGKNERFADR